MNGADLGWTILFTALQISIFGINFVTRSFLNSKPLGLQTLSDVLHKDFIIGKSAKLTFEQRS